MASEGGEGDGDGGGGDTSLNVQLRADDLGPGGACQFGGKMIFAGRDLNNNDRLDRSEVHTRETVCATEDQSLSVDFSEAGSSNTCPNGGRTATVGGEDYTFCHIAAGTDSGNLNVMSFSMNYL